MDLSHAAILLSLLSLLLVWIQHSRNVRLQSTVESMQVRCYMLARDLQETTESVRTARRGLLSMLSIIPGDRPTIRNRELLRLVRDIERGDVRKHVGSSSNGA